MALASCAGTRVFAFFYVVTVFAISYWDTELRLSQSTMLHCVMVAIAATGVGLVFFAPISDRVGWRNLTLLSTAFVGFWRSQCSSWSTRESRSSSSIVFSIDSVRLVRDLRLGAFFSGLFDARGLLDSSVSYALAGVLGAALALMSSGRLMAALGLPGPSRSTSSRWPSSASSPFLLLSKTYGSDLPILRRRAPSHRRNQNP